MAQYFEAIRLKQRDYLYAAEESNDNVFPSYFIYKLEKYFYCNNIFLFCDHFKARIHKSFHCIELIGFSFKIYKHTELTKILINVPLR